VSCTSFSITRESLFDKGVNISFICNYLCLSGRKREKEREREREKEREREREIERERERE